MIMRHITDLIVGQLVQILTPTTTRLAVVDDVGTEDDDEIRVIYCTTGAVDSLPADRLVLTGRVAEEEDFTAVALAAINQRDCTRGY